MINKSNVINAINDNKSNINMNKQNDLSKHN